MSQNAAGQYFEAFDVVEGGPAAEAGIKVRDKVLVVDGKRAE